jgi:hypothetical protein
MTREEIYHISQIVGVVAILPSRVCLAGAAATPGMDMDANGAPKRRAIHAELSLQLRSYTP